MKSIALSLSLLVSVFFGSEMLARASHAELVLHRQWTHSHGHFDKSAAEVVAFSPHTQCLYVTNSADRCVDILTIENGQRIGRLDVSVRGRPNSVAVTDEYIVVAVAHHQKTMPGCCIFFDPKTGKELFQVEVGADPDMVTVTPDGKTVLVANEGEPNEAYDKDPPGSISLVGFNGPQGIPHVRTADFKQFNSQRNELIARDVRISGPSTKHTDRLATVAEDLEPEYITTSSDGKTAWITLQENNAIAELDIQKGRVERIFSCGLKDHSRENCGLDVNDRDGTGSNKSAIQIAPAPVWGLYQPDAITAIEHQGRTYLITADEGDPREYDGYSDVTKAGNLDLPKKISNEEKKRLSRFEVSVAKVDQHNQPERLLGFGGRSYSIRNSDGRLVYDSGDQLEREIAARWPAHFNSSNGRRINVDRQSRKRGPEPEAITVGRIADRTYLFVALERANTIAIYDVSDPEQPQLSGMHMTRKVGNGEQTGQSSDDLGPETMAFIPAEQSPTGEPLLAVAFEVSGTTSLYGISNRSATDESGD